MHVIKRIDYTGNTLEATKVIICLHCIKNPNACAIGFFMWVMHIGGEMKNRMLDMVVRDARCKMQDARCKRDVLCAATALECIVLIASSLFWDY
jgi:hypothetical protein